jgi:hypothetical protein
MVADEACGAAAFVDLEQDGLLALTDAGVPCRSIAVALMQRETVR